MCNCGKKRSTLKSSNNYEQKVQTPAANTNQTVAFKYTGNTALTVTGSITRKIYRFNFPGDIQSINANDATAISAIAVLKRM